MRGRARSISRIVSVSGTVNRFLILVLVLVLILIRAFGVTFVTTTTLIVGARRSERSFAFAFVGIGSCLAGGLLPLPLVDEAVIGLFTSLTASVFVRSRMFVTTDRLATAKN